MKLSDQYDLGAIHQDINWRAPAFVRDHLAAAGLDELASFDFWDEAIRLFYVATDAGLYVGVFTPRADIRFDPKLEATITPWQDVTGVSVEVTTEIGEGVVVSLRIENPSFERSSTRDRDLKALAELAKVCLLRHGRR